MPFGYISLSRVPRRVLALAKRRGIRLQPPPDRSSPARACIDLQTPLASSQKNPLPPSSQEATVHGIGQAGEPEQCPQRLMKGYRHLRVWITLQSIWIEVKIRFQRHPQRSNHFVLPQTSMCCISISYRAKCETWARIQLQFDSESYCRMS